MYKITSFKMTLICMSFERFVILLLPTGASLFSHLDLGDTVTGVILLIASLVVLCTCLILTVKLLHSMMRGSIATAIKKTVNANFPGVCRHLTGYVAILVGAILTVLVQSSSIFTSTLTPLVGMGLIDIKRMYPLTLGSNIGTTMTGVLAACAASGDKVEVAFQIALCHLFFNVSGIILYYPIPPLRRLPIRAAKFLGETTAKYRWFAMLYLILMFIMLPASVFVLSLAGKIPFICVLSFVGFVLTFVVLLNVLQRKCPNILPKCFQTWHFLPRWMRSLEPLDEVIVSVLAAFLRCCKCCPCSKDRPRSKSVMGASDSLSSSPASSTASSTVELVPTSKKPSKSRVPNTNHCSVDIEGAQEALLPRYTDFKFTRNLNVPEAVV